MLANSVKLTPKVEGNFLFIKPTTGTGTTGFYTARGSIEFNFKDKSERDKFIKHLNISIIDACPGVDTQDSNLYFTRKAAQAFADLTTQGRIFRDIEKLEQLVNQQKPVVKSILMKSGQPALEFFSREGLEATLKESSAGESWLPYYMLTNSANPTPKVEGNSLFIVPTTGFGTTGFYTAGGGNLAFNFKDASEKSKFIEYLHISTDVFSGTGARACSLYFKPKAAQTFVDLNKTPKILGEVLELINSQTKSGNESMVRDITCEQIYNIFKLLVAKNPNIIKELDGKIKKILFEVSVKCLNLDIAKLLLTDNKSVAEGTDVLNNLVEGGLCLDAVIDAARKDHNSHAAKIFASNEEMKNTGYLKIFITDLLKGHSSVISFQDEKGYNLLHTAMANHSGDYIRTLLALDPPESVLIPTRDGTVSLINFVNGYDGHDKYELLSALINLNPEAALMTDVKGANIFHMLGRHINAEHFLKNHLELVKKLVFMKETMVHNPDTYSWEKSENGADTCATFLNSILSSRKIELLDELLHHIPLIANTPNALINVDREDDWPFVAKIVSKTTINPLNNIFAAFDRRTTKQEFSESTKSSLDTARKHCEEKIGNKSQISHEEYVYFNFVKSKILAFSNNNQELIGMNIDSFYEYLQSHSNHTNPDINELVTLALLETGTEESIVPLGAEAQHFTD